MLLYVVYIASLAKTAVTVYSTLVCVIESHHSVGSVLDIAVLYVTNVCTCILYTSLDSRRLMVYTSILFAEY